MNKELREKVVQKIDDYALQVNDRGHDASNPWITADELITLISTAILDEMKEKLIPLGREFDSYDEFDEGYMACRIDALAVINEEIGIDNLRGSDD